MSGKVEGERFEWFLKPGAVRKTRGNRILSFKNDDFEFLSVGGYCACRCDWCGWVGKNVKDYYCRFKLFMSDVDRKNGDLIKVFRHYRKLCGPCSAKALWMNRRNDDIINIRSLINQMEKAINERLKNIDNRTT